MSQHKTNEQQDATWKTCFSCDATYVGEVCGKCVADANRWSRALDRAIAEALDVYVSTDGSAFVESSSRPGLLYQVSREHCTCPAGENGLPCKHRACYLAQIGELPLDPEPERVSFFGNADRQEVRVAGLLYGDAVADQYGGWQLLQGRYPHAKMRGTYCSLDEIRRELERRLPVAMPAVRIVELAGVAA